MHIFKPRKSRNQEKNKKGHEESSKETSFQTKILAAVIAVIILVTTGTIVYSILEGWTLLDSAYFTTATVTTIGYGDIVPKNNISKIFTIFFAFSGVAVFLFSMTVLAEHYFRQRIKGIEKTIKIFGNQAQRAVNKLNMTNNNVTQSRRTFVKDMKIEHGKKGNNTPK